MAAQVIPMETHIRAVQILNKAKDALSARGVVLVNVSQSPEFPSNKTHMATLRVDLQCVKGINLSSVMHAVSRSLGHKTDLYVTTSASGVNWWLWVDTSYTWTERMIQGLKVLFWLLVLTAIVFVVLLNAAHIAAALTSIAGVIQAISRKVWIHGWDFMIRLPGLTRWLFAQVYDTLFGEITTRGVGGEL